MHWWLYVLMLLSRLAAFKYLSLLANLSAVFAFCFFDLPTILAKEQSRGSNILPS
jgi:hypothetical protein